MKILLLDLVVGAGGGQRSLIQLNHALQRLGNDTSIFVANGSWLDLNSNDANKYVDIALDRKSSGFLARSWRMLVYLYVFVKHARKFFQSELVIVNDPELLLPFSICNSVFRKKLFFFAHLIYTPKQLQFLRLVFTFFSVNCVVCCSEYLKSHLIASLRKVISKDKYYVVNPQINSEINFLDGFKYPILGVATFGRLIRSKGHDVLKLLARKHPNIPFYIAGEQDSSSNKYMDELLLDCPVNLTFIGYQSNILSCCLKLNINCILVCSRDNNEAFGLVALEAVKMGMNVIVRGTGGLTGIANLLKIPVAFNDEDFQAQFNNLLSMSKFEIEERIKKQSIEYETYFGLEVFDRELKKLLVSF